jgi:hypothetical protein
MIGTLNLNYYNQSSNLLYYNVGEPLNYKDLSITPSPADSHEDTGAVEVFSSQRSQFADYTTWKGIENKTGIGQEHVYDFVLKELSDNAVDYLETQQNTTTTDIPPKIHVTIKQTHPQEKLIRIVVSNSNYNTPTSSNSSTATFSKHILESIFDFDRYHSKRNQLKCKQWLCSL